MTDRNLLCCKFVIAVIYVIFGEQKVIENLLGKIIDIFHVCLEILGILEIFGIL